MAIDIKKYLNTSKPSKPKIDISKFIPKQEVKPKPAPVVKEKPRVVGFNESLGGGQYLTNSKGELILSPRSQNALPVDSKSERDHITSVALGGTSNKENLQYLSTTKDGRQSGKVAVEQQVIRDYQAGKISLGEARGLIQAKQQELKGIIPKQGLSKPFQVLDNIDNTTSKIGNFLGKGVENTVNLFKPKSEKMTFKVGEGLNPDQKENAKAIIISNIEKGKEEDALKSKNGISEIEQRSKTTKNPIKILFGSKEDDIANRIQEIESGKNPIYNTTISKYAQSGKKPTEEEISKLKYDIARTGKYTEAAYGLSAGLESKTAGVIKKTFSEVAKEAPKTVFPKAATKERGFISSAKEILPKAENLKGTYQTRNTNQLAMKAKALVKENVAVAEKIATTQSDDNAVAIASELIKSYGEKAKKVKDVATKNALLDRAAEVANNIARKLTEAGKSIQAASILGKQTPEGQVRFAAREIQKYNEAIEKSGGGILGLKKKIPELSGKQADEIITEMTALNKLPEGIEKAMRFKQLQDSIKDLVPSSLYDKIVSVWKAGLLTGVKTSGLNISSNASHAITETAKDIPAAIVDSVASLFTKKRTLTANTQGTFTGIKEGFEKGIRYFKTGYDERNVGVKLDWKRVNFGKGKISQALQKYEETVFRIIGAEDQPFYYGAKARSLYDQAKSQALNKGLKGNEAKTFIENLVQNPTDEMARYSVLDAETAVFQNKTLLGTAARNIQKVKGAEFIIPFGKTPSAVATQIINYSPVGIVKTILSNVGRGKFDQRLFSQGIGRGLTGTAIMWIGGQLLKNGLIVLDRPKDEKEQKLWELEGKTSNSIKIGNKYRSVQTLGPAGNLLLIGGHFQNAYNNSGSPTEAMSNALSGSAKSFSEQTFLKGTNQFLEAVNDPGKYGEGFLGNLAASFVPTISSDIARATDGIERNAQSTPDKIKSRVPGLRQTVEPQINVLGEERNLSGNFLETLIDPSRPSNINDSQLISELRRLWDKDYKVSPSLMGDKKGYDVLSKEENTELLKRSGELIESKLSNLIKDERYTNLKDDQKAKTIERFVSNSQLMAKVELVKGRTNGLKGEALKAELKKLKEAKLLTRDVWDKFVVQR